MESMITPPPVPRGELLHKRNGGSSNSSGALDTCGYLSGDYASPLTCGTGYTCSTGPSFLPSHLGCCDAVDCAPSSGAHTCITAKSGTIPCTGDLSSGCIQEYTSLLFCTDPTAPACVTYSQPPPSSGSAADAGLSPTIFSYSCGPTQTTHIYLATATNAPASASSHPPPTTSSNLPTYAYIGIAVGGVILLGVILGGVRSCFTAVRSSRARQWQNEQEQRRQRMMIEMGMRGTMGMGAGLPPGTGSGGIVMDERSERERLTGAQARTSPLQPPRAGASDFGGTTTGPDIARWLRDGGR